MTAKEFWEDDPQLFVSYRISFINKKERELKEEDYKCWLQGVYNHNGNSILFAKLQQFIVSLFSKNKQNNKIEEYPLYPYSEQKRLKEQQENKSKNDYMKFQKDCVHLGTLKKQYLDKISKEARKEAK